MSRNEPRSFLRLMAGAQWRIARRQIDGLRQKSRLMVVVIGLFVIAYWLASYFMFLHGFHFLGQLPGVGSLVQGRILYLFFAFLFVMLFISNIVIGYASLYKSEETQWMLSLPVDAREVFRWKMLETTILASWAFLFLSAPLILAYAWQQQAGPWFCLKTFAALLPFAVIPAGLGVMTVIVLTRYLSRRVFKVGLVGLGALAIVASLVWIKPAVSGGLQQAQLLDAFQQLLRHSRIAMSPLLPSYWLVQSMIAWGESWSWKGTFYFLVGLSNALLIMTVSTAISGRIFYSSWSRNRSQGNFRPGRELPETAAGPRSWMLEPALGLIPRLDACTRALIVKDIRLFRRDTAQWGQFVIFFGLLGLYVVNLRNVTYDTADPVVGAFVAFLNMMAASMTLGTLTTRFIPAIQLGGKTAVDRGNGPPGTQAGGAPEILAE